MFSVPGTTYQVLVYSGVPGIVFLALLVMTYFFVFLPFLPFFDFDLDIVCSILSFSVGTILSPRFRFLLRFV